MKNAKTQVLFVEKETKKEPRKMFALISLINSYYWKSFFGPFFSFLFPIIILGILGTIFGFETLLGGGLILPTMATGLISLPLALFEFKRSVLLKRIGATPINIKSFLIILGIYYLILMIFSLFWTMLMYLAIFNEFWEIGRNITNAQVPLVEENGVEILQVPIQSESLKEIFTKVEWSGFLYSHFISMILSITIGFAIVSVSKNVLSLQAIGISIFLLSMFLAAQVIPISNIFNNNIMWYLGYALSPFKTVSAQSIEAFNGSASSINFTNITTENPIILAGIKSWIWQINSGYYINQFSKITFEGIPIENIFSTVTKSLNFVLPYLWIGAAVGISLKWFEWGIR